jgi:Trypsin-like peptidase domain
MADETALANAGEPLRSAFVIGGRHILTAWHCVRESVTSHTQLWFRLRIDGPPARSYAYIPVRVTNYDTDFDVAALTIDSARLTAADLTLQSATEILSAAVIDLHPEVSVHHTVQVMGFPQSGVGADSDTNHATVAGVALPLGEVTGVKLTGTAFGAVNPVDPHGISGGPVLRRIPPAGQPAAIAVIRAIPRGAIPEAAAGASLVATRMTDAATWLPEVAMAMRTQDTPQPGGRAAVDERNVLAVSRACAQTLRESVVRFQDPELGPLNGWPHFFEEALAQERPTAIGTAYGLKLTLVLGADDGRLDRSALAETLWKLRRADGGWATRSGPGIGRPEVTWLILGALASAGFDAGRLAEATAKAEAELPPEADPVGMARTNVVCAVIRGLARVRPDSRKLAPLREILLEGAVQDPRHDDLLCWGSRLPVPGVRASVPSAAHTAMAVLTLARADRVLGPTGASRSAIEQASRWLVARRSVVNSIEEIRRTGTGDRHDLTTVCHFTAAWLARAILAASTDRIPGADALLDLAVQEVWRSYATGSWEWEEQDRPLWMTYQGACVVRDYAMRAWAPS